MNVGDLLLFLRIAESAASDAAREVASHLEAKSRKQSVVLAEPNALHKLRENGVAGTIDPIDVEHAARMNGHLSRLVGAAQRIAQG